MIVGAAHVGEFAVANFLAAYDHGHIYFIGEHVLECALERCPFIAAGGVLKDGFVDGSGDLEDTIEHLCVSF